MKKFKFSLDTVLVYKQQVLDALQGEHGAILAQVRRQEEVLASLWARYRAYNEEYKEEQRRGIAITDALIYQSGLRVLEADIARETAQLEELRKQEEQKRDQVVEAKKDTSSIEKLREKKLKLYQKEIQKGEEALIDEFVSAARVGAGTGASHTTPSEPMSEPLYR